MNAVYECSSRVGVGPGLENDGGRPRKHTEALQLQLRMRRCCLGGRNSGCRICGAPVSQMVVLGSRLTKVDKC